MTESKRYLNELRAALPRPLRRRVVSELRAHLKDGIAAETARGLSRDAAERITIERLGAPEQVAAQFVADAPPTPTSRRRLALVIASAALVAAAIAAAAAVTHSNHAKPARPRQTVASIAAPTVRSGVGDLVVMVQHIAAKQSGGRLQIVQLPPRAVVFTTTSTP